VRAIPWRVAVAEAGDSSGTQSKGTSAVGSRYRSTAREDCEDFMYAVVTVTFGVHNSVRLSQLHVVTFKLIINPNPIYSHTHSHDNLLLSFLVHLQVC
jgi:hypothetical protein